MSSKVDASIGLLTNVPKAILDELGYKFNLEENNNVQLIVLYRGTTEQTRTFIEGLGGKFQDLEYNFAIVDIPINKLQDLSVSNTIQYIELPKNLYEQDRESNRTESTMKNIELTNQQRIYLGLEPVEDNWIKKQKNILMKHHQNINSSNLRQIWYWPIT